MIDIPLVPTMEEVDVTKRDDPALYTCLYAYHHCSIYSPDLDLLCFCRRAAVIEIPQWAESRTLDALLYKYRCSQWNREFQDEQVRRIVCSLSLVIRLWSFGYCSWAIDAATLLDRSEPLEYLSASSLEVAKMRIFQAAYQKQFDEAARELEQAYDVFGEDAMLVRMRNWLRELEIEHRRVTKRR